jgi:hypothetical protein
MSRTPAAKDSGRPTAHAATPYSTQDRPVPTPRVAEAGDVEHPDREETRSCWQSSWVTRQATPLAGPREAWRDWPDRNAADNGSTSSHPCAGERAMAKRSPRKPKYRSAASQASAAPGSREPRRCVRRIRVPTPVTAWRGEGREPDDLATNLDTSPRQQQSRPMTRQQFLSRSRTAASLAEPRCGQADWQSWEARPHAQPSQPTSSSGSKAVA